MTRGTRAFNTETRNRAAWLVLPSLLAGWLAVTTQAHPQAQPVQPQAPVPATKATPAQGATTKKSPATARTYDRALLHPAVLKDKAPDQYEVKFTTTRGDFTVTVNRSWAPLGADRFYTLVKHHFYDSASFFRVLPGFGQDLTVRIQARAGGSLRVQYQYALRFEIRRRPRVDRRPAWSLVLTITPAVIAK